MHSIMSREKDMADLKLGLFGRTYLDTIVCLNRFDSGETNTCKTVRKTVGGIFNILKANLASITSYCFQDSQVEAFIISESDTCTRSSIVHSLSEKWEPEINSDLIDWLHVAYIDDLSHSEALDEVSTNISLDFCTLNPREDYIKIIKRSSLVFDSRERKHLYNNLNFETPLILHDKNGCECIVEGNVISEGFTDPQENLHVNGAGDIFAGIFIKKFYTSGLECAISETAEETKNHLLKCQNTTY